MVVLIPDEYQVSLVCVTQDEDPSCINFNIIERVLVPTLVKIEVYIEKSTLNFNFIFYLIIVSANKQVYYM